MLATTITLPPPLPERIDALRAEFGAFLADLDALGQRLNSEALTADPGEWRSALAEERDVRSCLTRLRNMYGQAERECRSGRLGSAQYTLSVISAILAGELPTRLRAWANAAPHPERALLQAWADDLEGGVS